MLVTANIPALHGPVGGTDGQVDECTPGGQGADADFGSLESLIILGVVTVACTGLAVFTVGRSAQQARI